MARSPDSTTGAARASRGSEDVPARVGRYEVRERLGAGTFGCVYRAFDPELNRDVAIKVPKADALTPELLVRFKTEALAAAAIHHANVCPIHDVGTGDDGVPFLVMRYVAGGTLDGVLKARKKPYSARDAAAVVRKIALGVAAAHAKGVLHRDLKPANVLWDEAEREVLVTDFGLARVSGAAQLSRTGEILGTPAYMSPEQARARQDEIGPLTDVYSLGVILYRLVTGTVPFDGSVMEVLAQAQFDTPRPPSEVRPGLDPRIDALCAKAMAKKADERYPSAKALADALADFLRAPEPGTDAPGAVPFGRASAAERVGGAGDGPVAPVTQTTGSYRLLGLLLVTGVLVVGAGVAFRSWQPKAGGDTTKVDEIDVPPLPTNPKAGEKYALRVGDIEMPFCWIPSGTFLMGSNHPRAQEEGNQDERPVHKVTIPRGFWMGRTEVTQAQWKAVMGTDPSFFKGSNRPVESVSWADAQDYCRTLTDAVRSRVKVRLPTEAEWEYAARAGTTTEYHFGDVIDDTRANYEAEATWNGSPKGRSLKQTTDVGGCPANAWGLRDVHGNVDEWCQDVYAAYAPGEQTDPQGQAIGPLRVLRGGAWDELPVGCRAACRGSREPGSRRDNLGFRVCFRPD